jgi:hypothetical protein
LAAAVAVVAVGAPAGAAAEAADAISAEAVDATSVETAGVAAGAAESATSGGAGGMAGNSAAISLMLAQAGAGVVQLPPGGQMVQRQSAERDLVWLLAGLMDMERDKKLALTRNQATSIWPIFKALVDEGLVRLEVDPAQFQFANPSGRPGETQGQSQIQVGQGQFVTSRDDPRVQEMIKQREAREEKLRQAIDKIEKVLSANQVAYVDNFEFDPAKYGLGPRMGGVRLGSGQNQGPGPVQGQGQGQVQRTPLSQQDLRRLMEVAKENAQKLADFYKSFQSFIQKKAGVRA